MPAAMLSDRLRSLRQAACSRLRQEGSSADEENVRGAVTNEHRIATINDQLRTLVVSRQELRARGSGRRALERNRRDIVRLQQDLSRALIALNGPVVVEAAA